MQFVCIASGPSLTAADCERVARWREQGADRRVIAVNCSWHLAPFADILYAGDRAWWKHYGDEASAFAGQRWTRSEDAAVRRGIRHFACRSEFENSGFQAVELALSLGAKTVYLLGYDMQWEEFPHWHADHPRDMGNAEDVAKWREKFDDAQMRFFAQGLRVVNISRETALKRYPRRSIDEALACAPAR